MASQGRMPATMTWCGSRTSAAWRPGSTVSPRAAGTACLIGGIAVAWSRGSLPTPNGVTDTDGSRPDCWGYIAAYGWEQEEGQGIDEFR